MQSGLETNIHIMGGHGSGWEESAESWNAPAALERVNEKLSSSQITQTPFKGQTNTLQNNEYQQITYQQKMVITGLLLNHLCIIGYKVFNNHS